jgi:hypothetical protein
MFIYVPSKMEKVSSTKAQGQRGAIKISPDRLLQFQQLIDEMRGMPQWSRYIETRSLHLLRSDLQTIDDLLTAGVLK